MRLTSVRARSEWRRAHRWFGSIVLLAIVGGVALTAAQAARRTDTAFARDLNESRASDAVVNADVLGPTQQQTRKLRAAGARLLDRVDQSPLVVAHGRLGGANIFRISHGRLDQRLNTGSAFGLVAYDSSIGRTIATLRLQAGRLAAPNRSDEIVIGTTTARLTGWRVGSRVTDLREFDGTDLDPATGAPRLDRGTPLVMHVVGVGDLPEELMQPRSKREPRIYLSAAFARRFPDSVFYLNEWVRLRHGAADIPNLRALVADVNRAAPEISMPIAPTDDGLRKVNRANDPLVNGLWILAALAALVAIFVAGQSFGRVFATRAGEHAELRALGATRGQRFWMELATLVSVALTAALLAALVAYMSSPLTPIGAARDAEPHPGLSINLALTVLAVAMILAGTVAATCPAIWRLATATALPGPVLTTPGARRSRVADRIARSPLGAPATVGTRFAMQPGRGPTATPVRSMLASITLLVAATTAVAVFGVNLQRWTTTPRLYGWNWDVAVGTNFGAIPPQLDRPLEHFTNVTQSSALNVGVITVDRHAIPAIGIDRLRGAVTPDLSAGRLPRNAHEIVFGAKTMSELGTHLGQTVAATVGNTPTRLTIVGRTTFPSFGNERFGESGLGTGALGTAALFPVHDPGTPGGRYNYLLLRFSPGTARPTEQKLRTWIAARGCSDPTCVLTDGRPAEIDGYRNAHDLPITIGAILIVVLAVTLTHVLLTTMRRRTGDLAILRALGCTPHQLRATARWQAVVLTASGLLIGVPIGLVAGHFAWQTFTNQLGIDPGITWPTAILALGATGTLALATIVATAVGARVPRASRHQQSNP